MKWLARVLMREPIRRTLLLEKGQYQAWEVVTRSGVRGYQITASSNYELVFAVIPEADVEDFINLLWALR